MTISKLTSGLAIGAAALLLSVSGAFAVEAAATGSVNVRSGPGINYGVLGTLQRGDSVNITSQSGGWCRVNVSGPDGWVSCRYLSADNSSYDNDDDYYYDNNRPRVSIRFGVGGGSMHGWNDRGHGWNDRDHNGWNGRHDGRYDGRNNFGQGSGFGFFVGN